MTQTDERQGGVLRGLLEGKVAIITGASRGIGAATALAFGEAGAKVTLAARNASSLEALARDITSSGGEAIAVATDVGDASAVAQLVETTVRTFGRLDVAFNNAGEGHRPTLLGDITDEDFDRTIRVHLRGTFLCMRHEIAAMLDSGGGSIVNMSSTGGLQGVHGISDYSAAKHGVIGLTKSAALEYGARNIRINVVAPGPIENDQIAALSEEQKEPIKRAVPMARIGRTQEVAETVAWLCSDLSSFVTGTVVSIDGGRMAGFPKG